MSTALRILMGGCWSSGPARHTDPGDIEPELGKAAGDRLAELGKAGLLGGKEELEAGKPGLE